MIIESTSESMLPIAMKKLSILISLFLLSSMQLVKAQVQPFKALVLTERGNQHEGFVVAALDWLEVFAKQKHMEFKQMLSNAILWASKR